VADRAVAAPAGHGPGGAETELVAAGAAGSRHAPVPDPRRPTDRGEVRVSGG
jgi:hypothetical protein